MPRVPVREIYKQDPITFLVERRFPSYRAAKHVPPMTGRTPSMDFETRNEIRRKAEDYAKELQAKSIVDLWDMAAQEEDKMYVEQVARNDKEELQRPFNKPGMSADFKYWVTVPFWTMEEGLALCFGRDPEKVNWKMVEPYTEVSPFAKRFERARKIALRSVATKQISESNYPGPFLTWAALTIGDIPEALMTAARERGAYIGTVQTLQQERDALAVRVGELEQLENSPGRSFNPKDDDYPSELHLAYEAWCAVASSPDDGTAPKARVIAWLKKNRPELDSEEARSRIAIVCNWQKKSGRKKTSP